MNRDEPGMRLLPRTRVDGRPSYVSTDGAGPVSRLADRIESMQLGFAGRLLGHARGALAEAGPGVRSEFALLAAQLADALDDALLLAESRRVRLAPDDEEREEEEEEEEEEEGEGERGEDFGVAEASGVLSVPGDDLASGGVARRFVRDMARAWGLPAEGAEALEAVAGELVANALEHTVSRFIVVELTRSDHDRTAGVRVTDEGRNGPSVREKPVPDEECGRGLLIVEALTKRWGWLRTGKGYTVWGEVTSW